MTAITLFEEKFQPVNNLLAGVFTWTDDIMYQVGFEVGTALDYYQIRQLACDAGHPELVIYLEEDSSDGFDSPYGLVAERLTKYLSPKDFLTAYRHVLEEAQRTEDFVAAWLKKYRGESTSTINPTGSRL